LGDLSPGILDHIAAALAMADLALWPDYEKKKFLCWAGTRPFTRIVGVTMAPYEKITTSLHFTDAVCYGDGNFCHMFAFQF
jgi:hypothetical protein